MIGLIIFRVADNQYAINIENIQRIIQAQELTAIPNANPLIDGMMSYENKVIKVLNFKKLTKKKAYEDELETLFTTLKHQHKEWMDALLESLSTGASFSKTTNPHQCDLGMWLDDFNSYDADVSAILKELNYHHKILHTSAHELLDIAKSDRQKALDLYNSSLKQTYSKTMGHIDKFVSELGSVADSLQKLLFYADESQYFAIKVDEIVDIAHIEQARFDKAKDEYRISEYLQIDGVIELDGTLINIIKKVILPQ
jgi:chemotaxis signal transduction protein